MTTQARDKVDYQDENCSLLRRNGPILFDPIEHGLEPTAGGSANWKGFTCEYAVEDGRFLLNEVNTAIWREDRQEEPVPSLFGRQPLMEWHGDWMKRYLATLGYTVSKVNDMDHRLDLSYTRLKAPLSFTGGLLLGSGYIESPSWKGLPPALMYYGIYELILVNGQVTEEFDRSAAISDIRKRKADLSLSEMWAEINRCLALPY